jgi:hypothetical protein
MGLFAANLARQHGVDDSSQEAWTEIERVGVHHQQQNPRNECDSQDGGDAHGKVLREGQGLEEAALLR